MPVWRHTGGGRMGRAFTQLRSARCARAKSAIPEVAVSYRPRRASGVVGSAVLTVRRCSDRDRSAGASRACLLHPQSLSGEARYLPGPVRRGLSVSTGAGTDSLYPESGRHRIVLVLIVRDRAFSGDTTHVGHAASVRGGCSDCGRRGEDDETFETPRNVKRAILFCWMALPHAVIFNHYAGSGPPQVPSSLVTERNL